MSLNLDPVEITNLILAVAILILGVWVYERKKEIVALCVASGFGLFALSHALVILGYGNLDTVIIPVRVAGYLVVIVGLVVVLLRAERASRVPQRRELQAGESKQTV